MLSRIRLTIESQIRNGFVRQVGVLASGTALAQAITLLALPVVTRLYTPHDFALLAVFVALSSLLITVACLRLEVAIPIAATEDTAADLLVVALCSVSATGAFSGLIVWLFFDEIANHSGQPTLQRYLWLAPIVAWFGGAYNALQSWVTRERRFNLIAKTRLMQALGGAGTQVAFGFAGVAPLGLLLGQAMNSGAGVLRLAWSTRRVLTGAIQSTHPKRLAQTLRAYYRYPKYSTLEALLNVGGTQVPIIVIAGVASGSEAGQLILALRVLAAPMALIGNSVAQVFISRAGEQRRSGRFPVFIAEIVASLFKVGVGPLLFGALLAPLAFPVAFGPDWRRAGQIVSWMTPCVIAQFLVSPISMSLNVIESQRLALTLQTAGLVLRLGAVVVVASIAPGNVVEAYAVSSFLFYASFLVVVLRTCDVTFKYMIVVMRKTASSTSWWLLAGLAVHIILSTIEGT